MTPSNEALDIVELARFRAYGGMPEDFERRVRELRDAAPIEYRRLVIMRFEVELPDPCDEWDTTPEVYVVLEYARGPARRERELLPEVLASQNKRIPGEAKAAAYFREAAQLADLAEYNKESQ